MLPCFLTVLLALLKLLVIPTLSWWIVVLPLLAAVLAPLVFFLLAFIGIGGGALVLNALDRKPTIKLRSKG